MNHYQYLLLTPLTKAYLNPINPGGAFSFSCTGTVINPCSNYCMKKKILLILSVITSTFAFAQSTSSFGVRAGLSSASIKGDAVSNLKNLLDFTNGMVATSDRNSYFAGAYVSIPVTDVISVEPALYYSQKGYSLKGELNVKGMEFLGINAKAQLQSQYIDLPVLVKANVGGLQLFAGPQVSYLAKADLRTTAGILGFNLLNSKMDATNQFNRWDAGVTAGIGYAIAKGVNITAAYDHGLTKVDAGKNLSAYNRSFKVGLGINF